MIILTHVKGLPFSNQTNNDKCLQFNHDYILRLITLNAKTTLKHESKTKL